ncbi:MAG TPA: TetR/AcrR family transcriptional regulator [Mycobacteriales bacterium]|jgi:AcrR family transcriptional regulator|nr:TetR/AcrR family transcriptional regulator [Mycobacteriales bacterium]
MRQSAEQRRETVLVAAGAEFATGGFQGTSTETIARKAGISQPYLFRLFPTKKDLFVATITRGFARVEGAFEQASAGQTGEDALCAMGEAYMVLLADRELLLTQLHAYASSDDPDVRAAAQAGFGHLWNTVDRIAGLPADRIKTFFAMGMLLNVAAALDLSSLDERWAQLCVNDAPDDGLCSHDHVAHPRR